MAKFAMRARALRRFLVDARGVAAVELALLLPVTFLFLGLAVFGGEGLGIQRKLTLATRDITDLVGQTSTSSTSNTSAIASLNQSTLDYYIGLSALVVYPYDPTQLMGTVSEIQLPMLATTTTCSTSGSYIGTIAWSEPYNGATKLVTGSNFSVPGGVACSLMSTTTVTYLLVGQLQYNYTPIGLANLLGSMTITGQIFMIPRSASQITVNWGS
jgi:Flp pilus assembly protein TadG